MAESKSARRFIRFDDESDSAEIWTASEAVYRRLLKRLGRAYLTEDDERHAAFKFPANFLRPTAREGQEATYP